MSLLQSGNLVHVQAPAEPAEPEAAGRSSMETGMCKLLTDLGMLNGKAGTAPHSATHDHLVSHSAPCWPHFSVPACSHTHAR